MPTHRGQLLAASSASERRSRLCRRAFAETAPLWRKILCELGTEAHAGAERADLRGEKQKGARSKHRLWVNPPSSHPRQPHHFCDLLTRNNRPQPLIPRTQRIRLALEHVGVHV